MFYFLCYNAVLTVSYPEMTRHGYRKISQNDEKTPQKVGFVSYVLFLWMNSVFRTGERTVSSGQVQIQILNERKVSSINSIVTKYLTF